MTINEMLHKGIRLSDITTDELLALQNDSALTNQIAYAVNAEIVRRLTYGTGNAASDNPELPLPQR